MSDYVKYYTDRVIPTTSLNRVVADLVCLQKARFVIARFNTEPLEYKEAIKQLKELAHDIIEQI